MSLTRRDFDDLDDDSMKVWNLVSPERRVLIKLRHLSLRNKSWIKVLNLDQRRYIDAVIMAHIDRIRSRVALRILAPIVKKLLVAIGGSCAIKIDDVNTTLMGALTFMSKTAYEMMKNVAKKISSIAQKWSNNLAVQWQKDEGFIKYLIMMSLPQNKNLPAFTLSLKPSG